MGVVMTQSLLLEPTDTAQWLELVREAEKEYGMTLPEDIESYLVFMLMRHTRQGSLEQAIMALEYLRAVDLAGAQRDDKLRDIGDQCLILSGLYPKRARRRNVRVSYYVDMGQSAYYYLSNSLQHASAELYQQLCEAFVSMMDILQTIRGFNTPVLQPIQSLELWSDTGSQAAYRRIAHDRDALPLHESLIDPDLKQ